MGTLAKVAGFAIVLLAMFCLLGKMSALEARVDHLEARVDHLEHVTSWLGAANGRLEEGCLARQAAVNLWLQSIRLAREDHLDKFVAWLGKAVRHDSD